MSFVGPFPGVANVALQAALPPAPGVAAVAAGGVVPPIADGLLTDSRVRTQMILSAVGVRSTVAEGTEASYKLDELYAEKRAREAAIAAGGGVQGGMAGAGGGGGGAAVAAAPPWAAALQASLARMEARALNKDALDAADALQPLPGVAAPFLGPAAAPGGGIFFPADLAAFAVITTAQLNALLGYYGLVPAGAGVAGHAAGVTRLGSFIGLRMDASWEKSMERGLARASNASAHVAAHTLVPLRGPLPPFGFPPVAQFPATSDDLRNLSLVNARLLCGFYDLPPRHGAGETQARRNDLAMHIGLRI